MVCNFHGFLPKENIIYFSHRRDPRKNVELLYRENRGDRFFYVIAIKRKKKSQDIYNCVVLML